MLKEKINTDFIKAFKEKDTLKKSLLGSVKGEMQTIEKNIIVDNLSDDEVTKLLNRFAKNLKENISMANDEKSKLELEIIESYLPKEMTTEEAQEKINSLIASGVNNMGLLMKEFAKDQIDKKMVSEMIKKSL